ncbi:hypothetical protein V1504DRAFT_453427 [Lipomyces starkeyi]
MDEPSSFINNVATFLSAIAQAFAQHLFTFRVFSTICLSCTFSSPLSFKSFSICYSFLLSVIFVSARRPELFCGMAIQSLLRLSPMMALAPPWFGFGEVTGTILAHDF